MIDTLVLSDGRAIEISLTDADEVTISGDTSRLSPPDAGMVGQGIERAAVFAGQRRAKKRMRELAAAPRLSIEQIAAAVCAGATAQPPEPADAGLHAASCGYRRNWACDCGARS